jgi:hypothetical protein
MTFSHHRVSASRGCGTTNGTGTTLVDAEDEGWNIPRQAVADMPGVRGRPLHGHDIEAGARALPPTTETASPITHIAWLHPLRAVTGAALPAPAQMAARMIGRDKAS